MDEEINSLDSYGFILFFEISGALCSCLLPESLQVSTVKQLPEYHEVSGEFSPFCVYLHI